MRADFDVNAGAVEQEPELCERHRSTSNGSEGRLAIWEGICHGVPWNTLELRQAVPAALDRGCAAQSLRDYPPFQEWIRPKG